ncbi:MAG TPA: histidine kinase [Capillimicrobium sp.]
MSGATTPIAERLATAAELQDLLAHRVTVIAVQAAAAAQAAGPEGSPLHGPLSAIAATSHEAMADLRRLRRVLDHGRPPAYRPQPSLAALPALPVQLDLGGVTDGDLGQSVALCAFRAVELVADDCLARQAATPAVALALDARRLTLTFDFAGSPAADRRVAARLRERLRPCGGVLRTAHNRWHARLPLEA